MMNLHNFSLFSLRLEAIIDPYPLIVNPDTPPDRGGGTVYQQRAQASETMASTQVPEARDSCVLARGGKGCRTVRGLVRRTGFGQANCLVGINFEKIRIGRVIVGLLERLLEPIALSPNFASVPIGRQKR